MQRAAVRAVRGLQPDVPRATGPLACYRAFVTREGRVLNFQDGRIAFEPKTMSDLLRAWFVFQTCAIGPIVRNCDTLYSMGCKFPGRTITHFFLRHTFFNHFCAGESAADIKPRMDQLKKLGVGGILDYAAEAKDDAPIEAEKPTDDAELTGRRYDYQGEATCDANMEIFFDAIRGVRDASPDGFAAIKLSGLGNPLLLERMSTCIVEMTRLFRRTSDDSDFKPRTPFYRLDRECAMDYQTFKEGWGRMFDYDSEEEIKALFDSMDTSANGMVTYLEWSSKFKLSEINTLVRKCKHQGVLYQAALNDEEIELYRTMIKRTFKILDLAHKLGVRVMVDAEWMDIQPAIDHIVHHLQRKYNRDGRPVVFNTYQTYLKGMDAKVKRDLERSAIEGWHFGAKLVRGAYMVSERKKAHQRDVDSPVCDTYEDTEANYHRAVDACLMHKGPNGEAEVLVASHNRASIEFTLRRMEELGKGRDKVYFGQLLGMADHLTFTLGANGYNAYKYVPYGPIDEVVPYLIRRTQENSAILGSQGVQEERAMVRKEVLRRLRPF